MENHFDENSPIYATEFVNNSELPWKVCEYGDTLFLVQPGKTAKLESWKPTTNWARWSKVVRGKDLRLTLTENPQWSNPWEGRYYCLELENFAGAVEENVQLLSPAPIQMSANNYVTALRDVPRTIPLNLLDPLIKYKKIVWKMAPVKVPIDGTPYFRTEHRPVKQCIPRDKGDLKNVLAERRKIEIEELKERQEKAEQEREATSKKIEQELMG